LLRWYSGECPSSCLDGIDEKLEGTTLKIPVKISVLLMVVVVVVVGAVSH